MSIKRLPVLRESRRCQYWQRLVHLLESCERGLYGRQMLNPQPSLTMRISCCVSETPRGILSTSRGSFPRSFWKPRQYRALNKSTPMPLTDTRPGYQSFKKWGNSSTQERTPSLLAVFTRLTSTQKIFCQRGRWRGGLVNGPAETE